MTDNGNGKPKGLGTFGGVFTPSILTILGVIMYLRFGWVVGNVGLLGTLIIVTLSTTITFLTSLSIAAIATDQTVKGGGAYYMISRSLGIESGGAIGIPLYIAQTLSVALYTIGFAESLARVFPSLNEKMVGIAVTLLIGAVAMISAKVAIKTQFFILAAIVISLLSLVFGEPLESAPENAWAVPEGPSESFWIVFAVFFPAVTGIMAGVNMSGDLKNPSKSIPLGTFLAVGAGYLIYMSLPLVLANRADTGTLLDDPLIMRRISFWGDAILLGVWGATLSSALGSILGAPRVLQALARDRVLPKFLGWLGKGTKKDDTPRNGTIFSLVIALVAVYMGNLNLIAPILTMFFLTTYGVLNISAGIEGFLGNPSFRPTFKVSWIFSLLGAVGCGAVMFLINPLATIVAILLVIVAFIWLERRELKTSWGDVRQGIWMALTRAGLLRIRSGAEPKSWYPHLMVLSGAPTKRWHLVRLARDIVHNKGLMTVASVIPSDTMDLNRQQQVQVKVREYLLNHGINSMVKVISASTPYKGGELLTEAYGLGSLYPNTIVVGDSSQEDTFPEYCRMLKTFHQAKRNVLIVRDPAEDKDFRYNRIIVWSAGLKGNGALMIILAHLLNQSSNWREAEIVLKRVVNSKEGVEDAGRNFDELLKQMRIDASHNVIISDGRPFFEIMKKNSQGADLVLLGLATPDENFTEYFREFREKTIDLSPAIYVLAGQELDFSEVLQ